MRSAQITLDPAFRIGEVDRRLFGTFVEHMGRSVYSGIFEPGHPEADPSGFRGDVLTLVRDLGPTVARYPGGNFVSGYRWEDGVGPVDRRPTRLDLAWRSIEPNAFGTDEFVAWAREAATEPMLAVNLGTRGVQEAADLLEYCNHPGGTRWSDLRVANGSKEPHDVRLWCLGNELDGPWQIGHKTADEYGRLAAETARAMRRVDPRVELVVAGSSNSGMPTFGSWEATVLEHTYDLVDYVSVHAYYEQRQDDLGSFLASATDMDHMIRAVVATADHVGAKRRSRRRLQISFDEWNVWYQSRFPGEGALDWTEAPALIEDDFNVADAVVVGDLLITLLRHADRVGVACQAQLVNIIAPIRTAAGGPAWRQTIFHPFALTSRYARGVVLRVEVQGPRYSTARYGDVPVLDATATQDSDTGEVVVLAVNRDQEAPLLLEADVRALAPMRVLEHLTVSDSDHRAVNTASDPGRVVPRRVRGSDVADGRLNAVLPALSWNLLRLVPSS